MCFEESQGGIEGAGAAVVGGTVALGAAAAEGEREAEGRLGAHEDGVLVGWEKWYK